MSSQPHDLMNSAASSAGDIPAKKGQFNFTTGCIPMAAACSGVVALVGVVIFGLWHRGHRDEFQRKSKESTSLQKNLQKKKKKEQDNVEQVVATLQEQMRGQEEMRDQLIKQLEKVEAEKKENKENLQSLEMEITRLETTQREKIFDKMDELIREKENLIQAQGKLDETKKNDEGLKTKTKQLLDQIEFQLPRIRIWRDAQIYVD